MNHSIKTQSYLTEIKILSKNLISFERQHHYHPPQKEVDVFGDFWVLGFADIPPNSLSYSREGIHSLSGPTGILIPPFSVVEWIILSSELRWTAFIWKDLPIQFPVTSAMAFEAEGIRPNSSLEDILDSFAKTKRMEPFSKISDPSDRASWAKQRIDAELGQEFSISALAESLQLLPSSLTRFFKKTYGISPVIYRNKLRVFDSMFRLLFSQQVNVSDIGFDVGFSDLSRFNKEFKKYTLTTPSKFQPRESIKPPSFSK